MAEEEVQAGVVLAGTAKAPDLSKLTWLQEEVDATPHRRTPAPVHEHGTTTSRPTRATTGRGPRACRVAG